MSVNDLFFFVDVEISLLQQARTLLAMDGSRGGKSTIARPVKTKRTMSTEARAKIAAAQRKRWAAQKKTEK
jgi:hypothetical protein